MASFLKFYYYKAGAWLLCSECFIAAKFPHFGNCAVSSSSWSGSKSKAWNHCEPTVLLSLIDGLGIVILRDVQMLNHHHLEHRDSTWFFKKGAQKGPLRSPVAFVTSGTTELKAAPLWDDETLSSVIYYWLFFLIRTLMKVTICFKVSVSKYHPGWSLRVKLVSPCCGCPKEATPAMPAGSQVTQLACCTP